MSEAAVKEVQEETQEAIQSTEIDDKARKMGWVGESEWKGDKGKWRPAAEFVERGENIVPILKDRLNKMETDLKIALKSNAQEIQHIKDAAYEEAKLKYESKVEELDGRELEAFNDADAEAYQKIKKEIKALKEPEKPKEVQPEQNIVFEDWSKKNTWYQDDSLLRRNADLIAAEEFEKDNNIDPSKLYGIVESRIKEDFAHKFTNPNREEAPSVEGGEGSLQQEGNEKFADLPKAAKDSFNRLSAKMKEQGREYSKKQFLEAYFE